MNSRHVYIVQPTSYFLPFRIHKSPQNGGHGQKGGRLQDRLKIWHVVKATNCFVCVTFLSRPRLYRSRTLGCWQNDGWSMVKWLAIVKALKTSSKAQTNDHFTLYPSLIHCPNWKMRPLVSKHKTTDTMCWNTNLPWLVCSFHYGSFSHGGLTHSIDNKWLSNDPTEKLKRWMSQNLSIIIIILIPELTYRYFDCIIVLTTRLLATKLLFHRTKLHMLLTKPDEQLSSIIGSINRVSQLLLDRVTKENDFF